MTNVPQEDAKTRQTKPVGQRKTRSGLKSVSGALAGFLPAAINQVAFIKTRLQLGFAILTVLAFVAIQMNANTPVLPQIFVFSVVPLIISMSLTGGLKKVHQFVIVMIISMLTLAFLGTGVTLSLRDQTTEFLQKRADNYALESSLNAKYLFANEAAMPTIKNYADYRAVILAVASEDDSQEMIKGFDTLVNFYEDYISCVRRLRCWPSAELDQQGVDFWYTYRPIIEERRLSFWGPNYARSLQDRAEALQPPRYLSAVEIDPITHRHVLVSLDDKGRGYWQLFLSFLGVQAA